MGTGQLVTGIIMCVIALALGIYAVFAARQRGPILTNAYIWATEAEREKLDKPREYHLAAVVFGVLALVFLVEALYAFTTLKLFLFLGGALIAFELVYAILDAVQTTKREKAEREKK